MKLNPAITAAFAAAFVVIGCSGSEGDTTPLPSQEPQARLENAQKNVETSNMSPQEKQAAAEYMRQGAADAAKMKQSAQPAGGS